MKQVFIDTSFFKALVDDKDEFWTDATAILSLFERNNSELITTNYIVDETATLLRVRNGLEKSFKFRRLLMGGMPTIKLVRATIADDATAWDWFKNDWSQLSFTDCVSFAVMKRLELTHVATFDKHFQRAGFTIVKSEPATLQKNTE